MKFAHMADCHVGGWKEPKLAQESSDAFFKAIQDMIQKQVDFVLIAGDLFNTSLPSIDKLKEVVIRLRQLKDNQIPVYAIAGSHDFSPSGKTMIDVLEEAGLLINVVKGQIENNKLKLNFTIDKKTQTKITGMLGKKGSLDKKYYENLEHQNLEQETGYKIFMFHTTLTEYKPEEMEKAESAPISLLPKGFNYYAGGHVHYIFNKREEGYGLITYPGALFPNNFTELEKYGHGGYYLVENDNLEYVPIKTHETKNIIIDSKHQTPQQLEQELTKKIQTTQIKDCILTIRVKGTLESGKTTDINFKQIIEDCYQKGAYVVLKNTNALTTKELEEIKTETFTEIEDIEEKLIKEHTGQIKIEFDEIETTKRLMQALDNEKQEGEKNADYEKRILNQLREIIKI